MTHGMNGDHTSNLTKCGIVVSSQLTIKQLIKL